MTRQSMGWRPANLEAAISSREALGGAPPHDDKTKLIMIPGADPLTGLATRRVLHADIKRWQSSDLLGTAALLFCGLDRLGTVNDSLGYQAGDELIQAVALRLFSILDNRHLLARHSTGVFAIFCESLSEAEATTLARSILRLFESPFPLEGEPYQVSVSVGIALTDKPLNNLLHEADAAMWEAKRHGANCAMRFHNGLQKKPANALRAEQDLFCAIAKDEFQVHFQPIIALPEGRLVGFEALVRWWHPQRGMVSPVDFIPLAEQIGLIGKIGQLVAEKAISGLADLQSPVLNVSINVSANQLRQRMFANHIRTICNQHDVAPARITIELTESALMQGEALEEIDEMRKMGYKIALDDFGTGYSSLANLQRLPVDIVKIDRSFIVQLESDTRSGSFLRGIISLIDTLNLQVVVEGVETLKQLEILNTLGSMHAQGYLFGKPQPIESYRLMKTEFSERPTNPWKLTV